MSELSDLADLHEETRRLNLTHDYDIMRWFSRVTEYWLKTGQKLDPTRTRPHMFEELRELWGRLPAVEPDLIPPTPRNSREYDIWVVKWVKHFFVGEDVDREHIILVVNEIREWVRLPRLDV